LGFFDVILFPGVLYHLRYPFWGLKVLRDMMKPDGELLTETAIWPGDSNNAMSPYEPSSCTFFNEKGLVDTLKSLNFDTVEVEFLPGRSLHDQIARCWIPTRKLRVPGGGSASPRYAPDPIFCLIVHTMSRKAAPLDTRLPPENQATPLLASASSNSRKSNLAALPGMGSEVYF
jgi:Protein of unknown function (DUF1698)